jgi:hypothetical protein
MYKGRKNGKCESRLACVVGRCDARWPPTIDEYIETTSTSLPPTPPHFASCARAQNKRRGEIKKRNHFFFFFHSARRSGLADTTYVIVHIYHQHPYLPVSHRHGNWILCFEVGGTAGYSIQQIRPSPKKVIVIALLNSTIIYVTYVLHYTYMTTTEHKEETGWGKTKKQKYFCHGAAEPER